MAFWCLFLIFCFVTLNQLEHVFGKTTYDITRFGAKPDGHTPATQAFLVAWKNACKSPNPGTIYVPPTGRFLVYDVIFHGPCKNTDITFNMSGATLVAPDYKIWGNITNWVRFMNVIGVTISGGTLDGQGVTYWACKKSSKASCPDGATTLRFSASQNIILSDDLMSLNSQKYHISINGCRNVTIRNVHISASGNSPNTDGIHVQASSDVTILKSTIGTGDDCIPIGPGTTNLWIEDVVCGPGHGISVGSLGKADHEAGVKNVTVKKVTFKDTQNGLRIKSFARPMTTGFARDIIFQHVEMINVRNPVIIDQNYCPHGQCSAKYSGVQIRNVAYQSVNGTSATKFAVKFDCSPKYNCTGIKLEGIKLTFNNKPAEAFCKNACGSSVGLVEPPSCLCSEK